MNKNKSAQGPHTWCPRSSHMVPKVLTQLQLHPVVHSMQEHVAPADHVEPGEVGHLTEVGPEGLVSDVADVADAAGAAEVSHTILAPSNSSRPKVPV